MVPAKDERDPTERTGLLEDQRGLTTIEYIIVLCLIAIAGFAIWQKVGNTVKAKSTESRDTLMTLMGTAGTGSSAMGAMAPPAM